MITDPDCDGNRSFNAQFARVAGRRELTLKECASYYPILAIISSLICS